MGQYCTDEHGRTYWSDLPCANTGGPNAGGVSICQDVNGPSIHVVTGDCPPGTRPIPGLPGSSSGPANPIDLGGLLASSAPAGLKGFTDWIGNSSNWKHAALVIAGGLLVLVGILAFAVDEGGSALRQAAA